MKLKPNFFLSLGLASLIFSAFAHADEITSPLDDAFDDTVIGAARLYRTVNNVQYPLLAIDGPEADGPNIYLNHRAFYEKSNTSDTDDPRNPSEIRRADAICISTHKFTGSLRDKISTNVNGVVLYDILNRKPIKPLTCFESTDKLDIALRAYHWDHLPIQDFKEVLDRANDVCSQTVVEAALAGSFAVDGNGMSPDQYKAAQEAAKARILGVEPGKILRSSYFTSITCSNEPLRNQ